VVRDARALPSKGWGEKMGPRQEPNLVQGNPFREGGNQCKNEKVVSGFPERRYEQGEKITLREGALRQEWLCGGGPKSDQ